MSFGEFLIIELGVVLGMSLSASAAFILAWKQFLFGYFTRLCTQGTSVC